MLSIPKQYLKNIYLGLCLCVIYYVSTALTPFIIGLTLAYICMPITKIIHRKLSISYQLSIVISIIIIYSLLVLIGVKIIPMVYKILIDVLEKVMSLNTNIIPQIALNGDLSHIKEWLMNNKYFQSIITTIVSSTQSLIACIFTIVLSPVISFYFLSDVHSKPQYLNNKYFSYCNNLMQSFVEVQLIVVCVYAIYYCILFSSISMSHALTIGCIAGIMSIIPYIGTILSLGICTLITIAQYGIDYHIAIIIIGFIAINLIDIMFISPKLIGAKFGLHPLVTIFSLLISANFFGLIGMIFLIPFAVVVRDICKLIINNLKST